MPAIIVYEIWQQLKCWYLNLFDSFFEQLLLDILSRIKYF